MRTAIVMSAVLAAHVLLAVIVFSRHGEHDPAVWRVIDARPLTFTGSASRPRLAPDGGTIVYVDRSQTSKIIGHDLRTNRSWQIFDAGPDRFEELGWSTDSGWLDVGIRHIATGAPNIWSSRFQVPVNGGQPRNVERFRRFLASQIIRSPDGTRSVRFDQSFSRSIVVTDESDTSLTDTLHAWGETPRAVMDAQWSPNSKWLVLASRDLQADSAWLEIVPADGAESVRTLIATAASHLSFRLLGDACIVKVDDDFLFVPIYWEDDVAVGDAEYISTIENVGAGDWDIGSAGAFVYAPINRSRELWVIEVVEENGVRVASRSRVESGTSFWYEASVSPDGSRIAAVRVVGGRRQLVLLNVDGTDQNVMLESTIIATPQWSPDGSKLSIDSDVTGERLVTVLSLDDGAVLGIGDTSHFVGPARPLMHTWNARSDGLFTTVRGGRSYPEDPCAAELDAVTGSHRTLMVGAECGYPAAASPDGKTILLRGGSTCSWAYARLLDVESGEVRPIPWGFEGTEWGFGTDAKMPLCGYPVAWTESGLFYWGNATGYEGLWWLPPDGSQLEEFVKMSIDDPVARTSCMPLSISSDGRTIACVINGPNHRDVHITKLTRNVN